MAEKKWTVAQREAIEADGCSLAISAAAGSGKTSTLTQRIIERLRSGKADVSRLLVVTFTRAAAAEMSARIEDALAAESAADPSNAYIARQLLLLPSASICTIDSFCLDIIRRNFDETGISGFSVLDADAEKILRRQIMDEMISDYFAGNVSGDGYIDGFEEFADTFGDPASDGALCDTGLKLYEYYKNFVGLRDAICGREGGQTWLGVCAGYVRAVAFRYRDMMRAAADVFSADGEGDKWIEAFSGAAELAERLISSADDGSYEKMRDVVTSYEESKLNLQGQRTKLKTPAKEYFKTQRKRFFDDLGDLKEKLFFRTPESVAELDGKTREMNEKAVKFIGEYERRLDAEKNRRRVMGFKDVERRAINLLWDEKNGVPTSAALDLSERYDEIYIDEYQDTDEVQDKIFSLLSRADNRFTVGDVKQSIYGFRGTDSSLFTSLIESREKYERGKGQTQAKIFLSSNFRSSGAILSAVNGVFDTLMNDETGKRYGEDDRFRTDGTQPDGPLPEIRIVCSEKEGAEEEYIARRIGELVSSGEADYGDIAVLFRGGSTALLERTLKAHGIPCRSAKNSEFFQSPEVLLALSVLNTVDNPSRDVYLAGALKSPIYGVTLDELLRIRRCKKGGTLFSALKKYTAENDFPKGERFLSDNEKFRNYAKIFSCGELVRRIYADTQMMSVATSGGSAAEIETARANLQKLYDYARNFERGGDRGLYGFISLIDEVMKGKAKVDVSQFSAETDAVNIMTMHTSKGLEFKACFIYRTGHRFNRGDYYDNVIMTKGMPVASRIVCDDVRITTPMHMMNALAGIDKDSEEELRLFYVAMTRAKKHLIMTARCDDAGKAAAKYDFTSPESECAMNGAFYSSYTRRTATNILDLVCAALSRAPSLCDIGFVCDAEPCDRDFSSPAEERRADSAEDVRRIKERLDFVYPFAALTGVPSKLSVSKLYPAVLDDDDKTAAAEDDGGTAVIAEPSFLRTDERLPDAAERGTAMHTFMQFFNFDSVEKLGVEGEAERLKRERFIFPSDAELLDADKLRRFFSSPLASEMRSAKRIYREKRFIIYYPADKFSQDDEMKTALAGEKLLVQGVIDCAFVDRNGELILVDYKTDFFESGTDAGLIKNVLRSRHRRQLNYYKYACEQMFGMRVAHTYIYSFALDGVVEL